MIKLEPLRQLHEQIHKGAGLECLIAGGSIRDYLSGRKSFKDIDVFLKCENKEDFFFKLNQLEKFFGKPKNPETLAKDEYNSEDTAPPIIGVANYKIRFDTDLQIVGFKTTAEKPFTTQVFESFDFLINCCGLNETGIIDTAEAKADRLSLAFTIQNVWSANQLIKIIHKYERLEKEKYNGYRLFYQKGAFH